jgi:hypothetical protein
MSIKRVSEDGQKEVEIVTPDAESVNATLSGAGLSSMRAELAVVPGVVQLVGNEKVRNAPKEVQAMLFLKAAGYTAQEIGAAFGMEPESVTKKLYRFDPNDEITFTTRNRREFQAFKIHRLQSKILDSVSDGDITGADLRDKVTAVSMLQKRSAELLDKLDTKEDDAPVDLHKALIDMLPVKGEAKQLPESTTPK